MFKSIKRSVLLVLAVGLFTAGVMVGSGQWGLVEDAVTSWNQAVTDVVDVDKAKEYVAGFLPESVDDWQETLREIFQYLTEKFFS